jgi:hypothetical protein
MPTYDFYNAGKFNGRGPDLWMFRYWRPDGTFGSCEVVEEQGAAKHREAIRALGYQQRGVTR